MKIIAFFLPQFHSIPENDRWWGKGFTEWTNVKKAQPLFEGHYQPRIPMNNYYYNLLDEETREWQANLAKEHGIYGFCYYHYWFKGKQLLEKPAQEILRLKKPDFPFCFAWANEPWTRAWDGSDREVLMPQSYGDENDWREHFEYLLNFFKDKRYIKVDNKPMFVIYRPSSIPNCKEMLDKWKQWSLEAGFKGLHLVEMLTIFDNTKVYDFDAAIEFEPMYTVGHDKSFKDKIKWKLNEIKNKGYRILDYDEIWGKIILRNRKERDVIYKGAFVDWDNSPRKKHALIFKGSNPEKFGKYLLEQARKVKELPENQQFLFINAWNEWAEGTYLEPDERYKDGYLKEVKKVVETISRVGRSV